MNSPNIIEYGDDPIKLTLVKKWQDYDDVYSFSFLPSREVPFLAGQNARISIPRLPEDERSRSMSFASTPSDEELLFSMHTKSGSSFKKAMCALAGEDVIDLVKIKGVTTLPEDKNIPVVPIAGGVGITPCRSILAEIAEKNRATNAMLVHVSSGEHLYQKELEKLPFRQLRICRPDVEGIMDTVTTEVTGARYYIAGSPMFIENIITMLKGNNIVEENILFSRFTGYEELLD